MNYLNLSKEQQNLSISLCCFITSIIAASIYAASRLGVASIPATKLIEFVLFSGLIQFFPACLSLFLEKISHLTGLNLSRYIPPTSSDAIRLILIISLLVLIAVVLPFPTGLITLLVLSVGAIAGGVYQASSIYKQGKLPGILWFLGGGLFSLWALSVFYKYQMPFFLERLPFGLTHLDTLFHVSLANMIKTHHIASNGLDGTPFAFYHFASHWFFVHLSRILHIKPLMFYTVAYPIIILPLLFKAMLTFVTDLHFYVKRTAHLTPEQPATSTSKLFWGLFIVSFISIFPKFLQEGLLLDKFDLFLSESYACSMTWIFFLGSVVILFLSSSRIKSVFNLHFWKRELMLYLLIPLMVAIAGLIKVSQLYLLVGCITYFMFRLNLVTRRYYLIPFITLLIFSFFVYQLVNPLTATVPIHWFDLLVTYIPWKPIIPLYFLLFYFWTWLFIYYELKREKIRHFSDLKRAFQEKKLLQSEILIFLSIIGFLPGNIYAIDGMSGIFFAEVQRWVAICFLMAASLNITSIFNAVLSKEQRKIKIIRITLILGSLIAACNFLYPIFLLGFSVIQNRMLLTNPERNLGTAKTREMVMTLYHLSDQGHHFKAHTVLYIPKKNHLYWKLLPGTVVPFLAPSLSEMAMIEGLPNPTLIKKRVYYGYENYHFTIENSQTQIIPPETLCRKALQNGYQQVLIIDGQNTHITKSNYKAFKRKIVFQSEGTIQESLLKCPLKTKP